MLPLTVQDIITRVQKIFGDESSVQIDNSDIIRWINEAQEEIVQANDGLMETTAVANSVIGQAAYSFPTDCATLRSIQFKGYRVQYKSFNEFNEYIDGWNAPVGNNIYGNGIPSVFMIWQNKFNVFPPPSEAVVSGFTVYYMRHPVQVVTTADTPEVPVEYHKSIIDYCLQQAYELDEDSEKQQLKGANFDRKMLELNDRNKTTDEYYPTITVLPEDADNTYYPYISGGY